MTILVTPTNEKIIENNLLHFSLLHILFANFLYYKNTISLVVYMVFNITLVKLH